MDKDLNKSELFKSLITQTNLIRSDKEKAEAFGNISNKLFKSGVENIIELFSILINEAESIKDDFYRCDMVKEFTSEFYRPDNIDKYPLFDKVIEYSNYIFIDEDRSESLINISEKLSQSNTERKAELYEKIINYSQDIRSDEHKAKAYIGIVRSIVPMSKTTIEVKYNLIGKIIEVVNKLKNEYKPTVFSSIVKTLIQNEVLDINLFENVIVGADYIISSRIKTEVFKSIVKELSKLNISNNDFDEKILLNKILEKARYIPSDKFKAEICCIIVYELCTLKDEGKIKKSDLYENIISFAKLIENEYHRSTSFEDISYALAKNNYFIKAISLIPEITDDKNKSLALSKIAGELAKR